MTFTVPFVLSAFIGLGAFIIGIRSSNWIIRLVSFIFALGGVNIAAATQGWGYEWVLTINLLIFALIGITALMTKKTGNVIMGIVLVLIAVGLLFATLNAWDVNTGPLGEAISNAFQQGWQSFFDMFNVATNST